MPDTPDEHQTDVGRGEDDRRRSVNPAANPRPTNPAADEEAVREGEENLDRVITK